MEPTPMNPLLSPGAPFVALSLAGALLAAFALSQLERTRVLIAGVRQIPNQRGMAGRMVIGQAAGIPLAMLLLAIAIAGGTSGMVRLLLFALALGVYLYVGIVLPRKPIVQAQQERHTLRLLTPGFVAYVRVALAGFDSPVQLLERYVARPRERLLPMQQLVAEALTLMSERRMLPFAAVQTVARARGCQELTDVADALAQAESEGTNPQQVLAAHQATLEIILKDEFQRMLKRRTMYLLLMVAISLVVGILANLLWVMVSGSGLLGGGLGV
ncbi:MAG TPA: hypothetical protein VNL77_13970 [Roseiflexaceae bacterium]|nr:hypothetical protein [Roseiflexaceae bacterium]